MEQFIKYKKNNQREHTNYSLHAIKFLDPDVRSLDSDNDGLLDFEVQTTLDTFQAFKKN